MPTCAQSKSRTGCPDSGARWGMISDGEKPKITFITFQILTSRKRTSFHFLAEGMWRLGWDVTFATVGISYLDALKKNARWIDANSHGLNEFREIAPNLRSYIHCPYVHPKATKASWLGKIISLSVSYYRKTIEKSLLPALSGSHVVVFESSDGVLAIQSFSKISPRPLIVYRPSDLLSSVNTNKNVISALRESSGEIDLALVPSEKMLASNELSDINTKCINVFMHGISEEIISQRTIAAPAQFKFSPEHVNVMTVGGMALDRKIISDVLPLLPGVHFHFFGDFGGKMPQAPNIFYYGEQPYRIIVDQAAHCDVGATFYNENAPEYLLDTSNKAKLFLCLGKPVITPLAGRASGSHNGLYTYTATSAESVMNAINEAIKFGAPHSAPSRSWTDACAELNSMLKVMVSCKYSQDIDESVNAI